MTDEQHDGGTPGAWQPIAPGEYEVDATAFVELPEGMADGYGTDASPLAAPGHGYVPPQIAVTPAQGAADPAGTGVWGVPGEQQTGAMQAQGGTPGAAGTGAVHWPDPSTLPPESAAQQHPGDPGTGPQHLQDPYGYDPALNGTGATQLPPQADGSGTGGPWHFDDSQGPTGTGAPHDGPAAAAGPSHVPGEWSIPLAQGNLPDETGEFTASMLAEQWGGVPPTTLPGGATAPWATGSGSGRPWDGQPSQEAESPQEESTGGQAQRMQQGVRAQRAGRTEQEYRQLFQEHPGGGQVPHDQQLQHGRQHQDMPAEQAQGAQGLHQEGLHGQQFHGQGFQEEPLQDGSLHGGPHQDGSLHGGPHPGSPLQGPEVPGTGTAGHQSGEPRYETPEQPRPHAPYRLESDFPPDAPPSDATDTGLGYGQHGAGADYAEPGAEAGYAGPGAEAGYAKHGIDTGIDTGYDDALYVHPAAPEAPLLPDAELPPGQTAPGQTAPQAAPYTGAPGARQSRPPRRPLQDTRVQEPLPGDVTGEHAPQAAPQETSGLPGNLRNPEGPGDPEYPGPGTPENGGYADTDHAGDAGNASNAGTPDNPAAPAASAPPAPPALSQDTAPATENPTGTPSETASDTPVPDSQDAPGRMHLHDEPEAPQGRQGDRNHEGHAPDPGHVDQPVAQRPQEAQEPQESQELQDLHEPLDPQSPQDPHGTRNLHVPRDPEAATPGPLVDPAATEAPEPPASSEIEPASEDPEDEDPESSGDDADLLQNEHPLVSYVLRVNGTDRPVTGAWIGESLLYVLRERLGLAGAKDGCSQGECGACNIQVDGRLVASCLVPAATTAGSEVRTVEGLAENGQPSDVQRALAQCGAVQCGFCIPGIAMTVHDLLEGNPAPTDLAARQALAGNLCRCSGYRGVLDAVRAVVTERKASAEADAQEPAPSKPAGTTPSGEPQERKGADGDPAGPHIPHQPGPGEQESVPSQVPGPRTTRAQYRDAAAHDGAYDTYEAPARYEDDGYDDGGRA